MRAYVAAFVVAAVVAAALTPLVRRLALRAGAVSNGGRRHVHESGIPRLGGVAICLALLAPILSLLFVDSVVAATFRGQLQRVVGLCVGAVFMCLVGLADDTRGVRALYKLYAQ